MRCGHRGEFGLRWKETGLSVSPPSFQVYFVCTQTLATSPHPPYPPMLPCTPPLTWVTAILPTGPLCPFLTDHHPLHSILSIAAGGVMLGIASLVRMQQWLPFHQSPVRHHVICPVISDLHVLPSSPHLLHSSHAGLLTAPHTHQTCTCLRAFALAVPSARYILPFS